jgi:sec-independent protein translocase protein TatB
VIKSKKLTLNTQKTKEAFYMFGIGMPEMILILAIALIVIGPRKLPELAKSLGRALGEFKKATSELKESMEIDSELGDVKKAFDGINHDIKETIDVTPSLEKKKSPDILEKKKLDAKKPGAEKSDAADEVVASEDHALNDALLADVENMSEKSRNAENEPLTGSDISDDGKNLKEKDKGE